MNYGLRHAIFVSWNSVPIFSILENVHHLNVTLSITPVTTSPMQTNSPFFKVL